jgi:hypothetical protein
MNLTDRNKKLIAGGIALVAILVIVLFVMRGRGRGQAAVAAGGGFPQGGEQVVAGPGPAAAPGGRRGGAAGGAGGPGGGAPAAEAALRPAQYPSIGVVKMGIGPAEPTRPDPFETFNPPPQPVPQELLYPLPPVGLVAGGLRPGGATETVARVGNRRVAGLLFNDQAWAILEDEEGKTTYIVKPGDVVEGIRITAIARDSIFLKDREGRKWEVPLRGLGPGGQAGGAEATASAAPGMPPA